MPEGGREIAVGVSYMYEPGFNRAILPLLESGAIDALEWSFDTVDDPARLPPWQQDLLRAFADAGRLYGHGVYYSLLNGDWTARQEAWLQRFEAIQDTYPFRHVSEHFGFMSSRDAHRGCPLPVPLTEATLQTGRKRLAALRASARCPVGIENLALAFSSDDVLQHGRFLEQLAAPVSGFLVLDLHNLYCQSHNFGIDLQRLISSYPLERVREIHLSGGSWGGAAHTDRRLRRDTHDDAIPQEVLSALPFAIAACPNLDLVIVERLGDTLRGEPDERRFREELLRVQALVREAAAARIVPAWPFGASAEISSFQAPAPELLLQQQAILRTLAHAGSAAEAKMQLLQEPSLTGWRIDAWDPALIDTAMQLGRKWGIDPEPA